MSVVDIENLSIEFPTRRGILKAIEGLSFSIEAGEILGVVGESGAGKSLTGNAIVGLLEPPGRVSGGKITLKGRDITHLSENEMRRVRGAEIGVIFQDPLTSLNPLYTVGKQLTQTILTHRNISYSKAKDRAIELLTEVGIPAPELRFDAFPHEFSGGMRQRVVIALALCCDPSLIIADEPTTALDVSVQAQIIALLKDLSRDKGVATMLVTHDMGVIAEAADRVAVIYSGRLVEIGDVRSVIDAPKHPYTRGLMDSIPQIGQNLKYLPNIEGAMPRLDGRPDGCAFNPRCKMVKPVCREEIAALRATENAGQMAACWIYDGGHKYV
ncbi:MAG: methionine ABC transporter ATP-binding protein [Sneathiella sp.]|jgi:peptide/nickel transport system ATP-binding protein|uniref:ABC transporter ATP-binding protein n=1 Tax=Sneathiella sp. TaxID=1964365 RepID=UPI000C5AC7C3|nr:ABC transporter ATP-binding protein [Sneathiella sp.]MAL79962.1 methionine ABC transporter ATP-binding protein [Sneathiella sp.]